ncbi:MAG: hypothetical protein H0U97_13205 [Gammaproteobacteria bacterium]|nr:hypothetical protein [Gammaproteobacteria bacterium]
MTHPNDANVFWYGARLHAIRGEWDQALSDLDQTVLLAPSWEKKYVKPLEKEIIKRKGAVK